MNTHVLPGLLCAALVATSFLTAMMATSAKLWPLSTLMIGVTIGLATMAMASDGLLPYLWDMAPAPDAMVLTGLLIGTGLVVVSFLAAVIRGHRRKTTV